MDRYLKNNVSKSIAHVISYASFLCVKSVRIRSYSGPYFAAFGLNRERYFVSLCILSECRKYGPE